MVSESDTFDPTVDWTASICRIGECTLRAETYETDHCVRGVQIEEALVRIVLWAGEEIAVDGVRAPAMLVNTVSTIEQTSTLR